jgi:hypothetical protein
VPNQDFYGAACDLQLKTMKLPLPDLAVGRLAETADEVKGMLAAYMSTVDGKVPVNSSLVTGYDFLTDSSLSVANVFNQGIPGQLNDTLISPNTLAPELCWTANDLRAKLFGSHHDIVYLAGHFSAGSALAADFDTTVLASEWVASPMNFTNTLVFSAGCHSGYNVVDEDQFPIVSRTRIGSRQRPENGPPWLPAPVTNTETRISSSTVSGCIWNFPNN